MADGTALTGARTDADREERILGIIETTRAKRPRFKDAQVTMAHGAGGKATQTLIEGLLAPAFGIDELADGGSVRIKADPTEADAEEHKQKVRRGAANKVFQRELSVRWALC